jgi:hypothetical protein
MTDQANEAGGAPAGSAGGRYRDWAAILNLQPIVGPTPLRVGGEYHLGMRCGGAALEIARPQGINGRILLLDLVKADGDGGDWIDVADRFAAQEGQYDQVQVVDWDGESITIDIEVVY